MSLFKQLVIMLTVFLTIILVTVMMLNFKSASEFVQNQLYTDAKNTAHSLGLSLSKVADPKDTSSMDTMINAIFDSGYYEGIKLVDIDGKVIYERHNDVVVNEVPNWFITTVKVKNVTVTSDIMMGWNRFGTLSVSGHTGNAYRQLYSTFVDLIQTFLYIGIIVFIILYLLLSMSLKSLKRIGEQAQAIIENQFIFEQHIPFTTEFRSVTVAMNAMVGKVKDIFERENETLRRYHELMYKDSETKLYNRRYVVSKLPEYLHSDAIDCVGVYALFSFDELDHFKKEFGYEAYQKLILHFVEALMSHFSSLSMSMVARLNESDFFILTPSKTISEIHEQCEKILSEVKINVATQFESSHEYLILGCGIGNYSANDTVKTLLSRADYSVTQAKLNDNFRIDTADKEDELLVLGREEWRRELILSLEESRILLASQSVVYVNEHERSVLHEEVFLRLRDQEGIIHSAGYFIPIASSLGLIDLLDRYMIGRVLNYLNSGKSSYSMALNLSADFVKKYANIEWLKNELESFSRKNNTILWFEVSNFIAYSEVDAVKNIRMMIKGFGHQFGIDHFTLPDGGAGYLQMIRPDYVKANSSYLSDIMIDKENGSARESLNNLTKSLGISIIAIMVEDLKEIDELKKLGITSFQGSFIAPVTLIQ